MPRDISGTYSLPASNPVATGQIIASTWANTTLSDLAAQLNNVITRDGSLGPTVAFKVFDGTQVAPGLSWNSQTDLGWYRASTSKVLYVTGGAPAGVMDTSVTNATVQNFHPRTAGGLGSVLRLNTGLYGDVYGQVLSLSASSVNGLKIEGLALGAAPRPTVTIDAANLVLKGAVTFPDMPGGGFGAYLPLGGGEMSGNIVIKTGNYPTLAFNTTGANNSGQIVGERNGNTRWSMEVGNSSAETGSNVGCDLAINRFADNGAFLGTPFMIARASGETTIFTGNSNRSLTIYDLGAQGACIRMQSSAGSKSIRCGIGNNFAVINSAFNSEIFAIEDSGRATSTYGYACRNGIAGAGQAYTFNVSYDGVNVYMWIDGLKLKLSVAA